MIDEFIKLPYRIFAVDPATTKSGWSVLDVLSLHPLKIQIVDHAQIDGQQLLKTRKDMMGLFQKQFCVLDALEEEYERLIDHYDPDVVVSESAFGYAHMSALIALTLAIHSLRRASQKLLGKDIIQVPPTISKKAWTGSGGADKDHMRLAYQTNDYLSGVVADDLITEHEIDSISHGHGHVARDILKTVEQVSAKEQKAKKKERAEIREEKKKQKEMA